MRNFFLGFLLGTTLLVVINKCVRVYFIKNYIFILPKAIYKLILIGFGESDTQNRGFVRGKRNRYSIERFEKNITKERYKIDKRLFYFINPNYEVKFGLKPRRAWRLISSIPFFRNFFITTNYYVVSKKT